MTAVNQLDEGTRLGKYTIERHIATGGMGSVYRAIDTETGEVFALKILRENLASRPALVERFRREARNAAKLMHPNIVTVREWGEVEGIYFLVMEYIDGIELDKLIAQRQKLTPEEGLGFTFQAAKALDHASRQGIVHRDIKPSNFLLTRVNDKYVVKLLDFGLARADDEEDYRVTRPGATVGTIDYLAPEQARDSGSADVRSDIYSLGCTLYHMLAGHPPFPEGGLGERIYQHANVEPPDVRQFNPAVPEPMWQVLSRMLAKSPNDRYQTPQDLLNDLLRLKKGEPPRGGTQLRVSEAVVETAQAAAAANAANTNAPEESDSSTVDSKTEKHRVKPISDDPATLQLSESECNQAKTLYEQAKTLINGRRFAEAQPLLLAACRVDPTKLDYRRALRKLTPRVKAKGGLGLWLKRLKFQIARFREDHRRVLELGEQLLLQGENPAVEIVLVRSAMKIGLVHSAVWMAERLLRQDESNLEYLRCFALACERAGHTQNAIDLWEQIRRRDPNDPDAKQKINGLMARQAMSRGRSAKS
jgi:serine/threonine protein kinase